MIVAIALLAKVPHIRRQCRKWGPVTSRKDTRTLGANAQTVCHLTQYLRVMERISEYEEARRRNIERNKQFLQQLGLDSIQSNLNTSKRVS